MTLAWTIWNLKWQWTVMPSSSAFWIMDFILYISPGQLLPNNILCPFKVCPVPKEDSNDGLLFIVLVLTFTELVVSWCEHVNFISSKAGHTYYWPIVQSAITIPIRYTIVIQSNCLADWQHLFCLLYLYIHNQQK